MKKSTKMLKPPATNPYSKKGQESEGEEKYLQSLQKNPTSYGEKRKEIEEKRFKKNLFCGGAVERRQRFKLGQGLGEWVCTSARPLYGQKQNLLGVSLIKGRSAPAAPRRTTRKILNPKAFAEPSRRKKRSSA